MLHAPEYRTSPARRFWPMFLIVAGVVSGALAAFLITMMVTGQISPHWGAIAINIAIWSPIMLGTGIALRVLYRRTEYLMNHGVRGSLQLVEIRPTASRIGARAVVILSGAVTAPGHMAVPVVFRTTPPVHLVQLLRPGAWLPVRVDQRRANRLRVDWQAIERASSAPTSLCPPDW